MTAMPITILYFEIKNAIFNQHDIADDRKRARLAHQLKDFRRRVQYSVRAHARLHTIASK